MKNLSFFRFWLFMLVTSGMFAQSPDEGLILQFSAKAPGQDLSGENNRGLWNNIALAPGIPGITDNAFYFNGTDSYIEVKPSASLDQCISMTIAMWYNPQVLGPFNSGIHLATRRFPALDPLLCLTLYPDDLIYSQAVGTPGHGPGLGLSEPVFMKKNAWYHACGVFDRGKKQMRLYLNGVLGNTLPVDMDLAFPKEIPMHIGCDMRNNYIRERFFKGSMEDIRIYDRALNDEEVRALTKGFVFSKPAAAFEKIERLDAGRYVLTRMDSSGRKGGPMEVVEISATEPIWKSGWFVACCIGGTFLLTFLAVHWYNLQRRQAQRFEFEKRQILERERFRIAREMHDDIGSGLSAINLLTEIALNKSKDPQLAAEIERVAAAARDVHARIQDIIWAISTQNDTLTGLLQHLQRFAADLLAPTGIVLHYDAPTDLPTLIISGERRRALFLAFKEALHNIVKHARATRVGIDISLPGKKLSVHIRDNGRGFDPATVNDSGNGLLNMQRRMEDAGGAFRIDSGSAGTTVTLQLPL